MALNPRVREGYTDLGRYFSGCLRVRHVDTFNTTVSTQDGSVEESLSSIIDTFECGILSFGRTFSRRYGVVWGAMWGYFGQKCTRILPVHCATLKISNPRI